MPPVAVSPSILQGNQVIRAKITQTKHDLDLQAPARS